MMDIAHIDNTEISGKARVSLDAPMSPLLDESPEHRLFAEHFSSTSVETADTLESGLFAEFFASTSPEHMPLELHASFGVGRITELTTLLHTDRHIHRQRRFPDRMEAPEPDPISKATEERVVLLARKYVAKEKYSDEEYARLAIVTERVRKLLPAVTTREYEALERGLTSLRDISKENASLRDKLRSAFRKNA